MTFGSDVSSDIKVTIFRNESNAFRPLGIGTTSSDGAFVLNTSDASEPLWLAPGDYRFTLQSIGPPIQFSEEFQQPESTSLKVTWTADMKSISLEAPQRLLAE